MQLSQLAFYRKPSSRHRIAWAVALILALLPLMLVVYLGSNSRLMGDDFCHLISGMEYGPWGNVLYWRNSYNGSYSYYFLHGLTAPLDTLVSGVFVVIINVAWLFGLVWLIVAGCRLFGWERPPLAQVIIVAAALVWLSINGLLTPLSIYFYSGASRHTLPIVTLVISLAACCEFVPRVQSLRRLAVACVIFAMVAFVNAGMSEVFATLQLVFLTTLYPAVYMMIPQEAKRKSFALIISGWAATVTGLLVMITAPGVARRLAVFGPSAGLPLRSPVELLPKILEHIQSLFIDTKLNTGFIGMLALAFFLMLAFKRPAQTSPIRKPFQFAVPPVLLCFLAQLLLLPLVWTNQSDNPLVFGRFSPAYMVVVGTHLLLLLSLALILLARQRINAVLLNKPGYWAAVPVLTLSMIFILFSLTQFRSINWHALNYISCSIYVLLYALLWQFHFHFQATRKGRFFAAAFWTCVTMCMSAITLVMINLALDDRLYLYSLSFVSFAFSFSGFICGILLAFAINQVNAATPAIRPALVIVYGSAIVAIAIWFGSLLGNARNIPQFEQFARAWDERHQLILSKRESGEWLTEISPLAAGIPSALGHDERGNYWQSYCASDEITALIEERYLARESIE